MELDAELKWKTRPGYSASSTPSLLACLMVPSTVSMGALKCFLAIWSVDSLVWRTCSVIWLYSASRSGLLLAAARTREA